MIQLPLSIGIVLVLMSMCQCCQTTPKPLVSCEALEKRIDELGQRIETLETQAAINQAAPGTDSSTLPVCEDRN